MAKAKNMLGKARTTARQRTARKKNIAIARKFRKQYNKERTALFEAKRMIAAKGKTNFRRFK